MLNLVKNISWYDLVPNGGGHAEGEQVVDLQTTNNNEAHLSSSGSLFFCIEIRIQIRIISCSEAQKKSFLVQDPSAFDRYPDSAAVYIRIRAHIV